MTLHFIRHGQTDWNVAGRIQGSVDTGLNANGVNQAEELGRKVNESGVHIAKIYTSRQKRAIRTAQILSRSTGVDYILTDGLEEINLGEWEGLTWEEVKAKYPLEYNEWYMNRRYTKPPKGESYQEMIERVLEALHKIISENQADVAVVTHGAVLMCLQCYITGTPFSEMRRFKAANAVITSIDSSRFGDTPIA